MLRSRTRFLVVYTFVIACIHWSSSEEDVANTAENNTTLNGPEDRRVPMKGESDINYGNLEASEPGFDITDEEIQKLKIWPQGIIPYFIDDLSFDKVLRDKLRAFLEHTNTVSGVHFTEMSQPPADDSRWVFFINRRGVLPCADLDFRKFTTTGVQRVVIGYDCMEPGNLAEIVLALVGVPPQHNAPDRDKFVFVEKENILEDKQQLFEKLSDSEWLFHDVEYDLLSAGHYPYHKYTANGGATLNPVGFVDVRTGEATSYSFNDIWKMRMLYNFISKKRQNNTDNTRACSKLFKPGARFREFVPNEDHQDDVSPRPKPSKYTGIPDEKLAENGEEDKIQAVMGGILNIDESENDSNGEEGATKLKGSKKRKRKEQKKKQALYMSDINTDK